MLNLHGRMHGGALYSLIDTALGQASHSLFGGEAGSMTLECKVNYIRGVDVRAARVDTRSPATALATFPLLAQDSAPAPGHLRGDPLAGALARPPAGQLRGHARRPRTRSGCAGAAVPRGHPRRAGPRLLRIQDRLGAEERNHANLVMAMHAAIDRLPEAGALYAAAGDIEMTPLQRA